MTLQIRARDNSTGALSLIDLDSVGGSNVFIKNVTCDASVFVGAFVRMTAGSTAVNALADSDANANVIGVVYEKPSSTLCHIRVQGVTESIFTGLDVSKEYFLSQTTPGDMTTTVPPSGSGYIRLILGQPFSATEFLVNKGERTVRP